MARSLSIRIEHVGGATPVAVALGGAAAPAPGHEGAPVLSDAPVLPDASALRARLEQALAARPSDGAAQVGVLSIECHGLKQLVADSGPEVPERALCELVRRTRGHLGPGDFLARTADTRLGLLLYPVEDGASVERAAGALLHDLTQPLALGTLALRTASGISIGAAVSPRHGSDAAHLLARSEAARAEAEALGADSYLMAR